MEFRDYLKEKIVLVNNSLDRLVPEESRFPQSIHRAIRYSLFAGGKRLRPILVLASCGAVGGNEEVAINTACAFECIHTYSLIHDDLPALDNDDLRRGKPTCHKVFGEATAILAGDALLTMAFELITKTPIEDKGVIIRVIEELAHASGTSGIIGGQVVDLESEGKAIDFPLLEYIHVHKTGSLILAAVRCGAILGGADSMELKGLTTYGECIGLAFQIMDDVLDVEGSREEMGKAVGADAKKGKATYPGIIGLEESKRMARELVERAIDALEVFDSRANPLRDIAGYILERRN